MSNASRTTRAHVRHVARTILVLTGFIVFYAGGILLGWLVLPLVRLFTWHADLGRRRCQRIVCTSFRWMVWYIESVGIFQTRVTDLEGCEIDRLRFEEPAVVVSNHPSLLDVVVLMSAMEEGVVVVKPWVYYNPFLGGLAWCCGYIRGGDGLASGIAVIRTSIARIEAGSNVVLFPEGTRSPRNGLNDFQRGAFRIARETGAPIAPMRIACEPSVLGKGQPLSDFPVDQCVSLEAQKLWRGRPDVRVRDENDALHDLETTYRGLVGDDNQQNA